MHDILKQDLQKCPLFLDTSIHFFLLEGDKLILIIPFLMFFSPCFGMNLRQRDIEMLNKEQNRTQYSTIFY